MSIGVLERVVDPQRRCCVARSLFPMLGVVDGDTEVPPASPVWREFIAVDCANPLTINNDDCSRASVERLLVSELVERQPFHMLVKERRIPLFPVGIADLVAPVPQPRPIIFRFSLESHVHEASLANGFG